MFLEKLSEFAEQMALPPPMYQPRPIRYVIVLDADGKFRRIDEVTDKKYKQASSLNAPYRRRTSFAIRPRLLVDDGEYTLGFARETSDRTQVEKKHKAYVAEIRECAEETQEPTVKAVARFLEVLDLNYVTKEKPDFDPTATITFRVDGVYPFDLKKVKNYWARKAAAGDTEQTMQCLVCGEMRPPVERLPILIRGIPDGQPGGLTLISANAAAFESYGLKASLIAPTCEVCGERFGNALNELLRREDTHIVIPPLVYIFWVRDPAATMDVPRLMRADPGEVEKLFQSAWRGKAESTHLTAPAFYAATLSANRIRVVLRDWIETSLDAVQENLQRYFRLQQLQDSSGERRYFPLQSLIKATINRDTQEKPVAQVGQALLRVALHGGQLPQFLLHKTIRRIRASRKVQPEQAALIKMVLLSNQEFLITDHERGHDMTTVNEDCKDAAYLCGRLLAQLDYIQYKALGKVNATIVDRFYGTASTAPAAVFPRLLRGAQPHLATIRQKRTKPTTGYMDYLDRELAKLLEDLPSFPSVLPLDRQGMFALGFYHQKAKFLSQGKGPTSDNGQTEVLDDTSDQIETAVLESEEE